MELKGGILGVLGPGRSGRGADPGLSPPWGRSCSPYLVRTVTSDGEAEAQRGAGGSSGSQTSGRNRSPKGDSNEGQKDLPV